MMEKSEIRSQIRALKKQLSEADKCAAATQAFARVEKLEAFIVARKVLLYHSLPDELPTHAFLQKWGREKQLFLPRVKGDDLEILPFNPARLAVGAFNIEEPEGNDVVPVSDMELIIAPGVAFDHAGNRIGRGKGYYDRLLHDATAPIIGVGYDFQLLDEAIAADPHDVAMDMVVTPSQCVATNRRGREL
jgi:5-formyltetrahydrofolate cyclo-ligase